ncbi:hypothetical protein [Microseira wollei]|uniref:hypothetical protein n=1 Tax=Microseira wollei TaxID=467598 RepID=UPI001CFC57D9|nr:hypothetical protein [Microseira wollei]
MAQKPNPQVQPRTRAILLKSDGKNYYLGYSAIALRSVKVYVGKKKFTANLCCRVRFG